MGTGIAIIGSQQAGLEVTTIDLSESALSAAKKFTENLFEKQVAKGALTESAKEELLSKFKYSSDIQDLKDSDIVIEAVDENVALKKRIIEDVGRICKDSVIIASNTSSISITKLAAYAPTPENFIGMHFFNPVPLMRLVEVIPGLQTSDETLFETKAYNSASLHISISPYLDIFDSLATAMGKTIVTS